MIRAPFGVGEWYHCYSRGVDKRCTFQSAADYRRFLHLMYLVNSEEPMHLSALKGRSYHEMFSVDRAKSLVAIAAYALMPNHFHILMHEINEGGITKFMQKLGTAYTMYFNIKNDRVGGLFVKPFRSKHIDSDAYLQRVAQYIHLNPIELFEPEWKKGKTSELKVIEKKLHSYAYSSLQSYLDKSKSERVILSESAMSLISSEMPSLAEILRQEPEYQKELAL